LVTGDQPDRLGPEPLAVPASLPVLPTSTEMMMALTGTTNTSANTAIRYLSQNQMAASSSLSKLSSGSRIVKASDDAASLAVGTKLKADVTALKQAAVNAGQASSLLQVADGGMSQISDILQRMKALAVEAQSGSVTDSERAFIDKEYQALGQQIDNIATETKFNSSILLDGSAANTVSMGATTFANPDASATASLTGSAQTGAFTVTYDGTDTFTLTKPDGTTDTVQVAWAAGQKVFDGSVDFKNSGVSVNLSNMDVTDNTVSVGFSVAGGASMSFQVGASASDTIAVNIANVDTGASGLNLIGTRVDTTTNATAASNSLDTAISTVNAARADMGALMSRFQFVSANLSTSVENLDAARSTLMDVDMATEMAKFSSEQVLTQAGVAMLAQANQMPQQMLRLLQ
jgi:flagellin